ncbi:peptidoglycan-binding protein [Novosphingobium sp. B-7]|uniref:peptidoglycan-binding domain-containing protein n=1 Tax=Novosphingobium sp. B-7 TaxID=1298855 RepID=UPI00130D502D|nr:peptidoglycan-binding domain-containing protein [Novosphingobium sp. B-7]
MKRRVFLIPSLFAAGFGSQDAALAAQSHSNTVGGDDPNNGSVMRNFSQDHLVTLASHSSHSSHSSHASHSSGGGGGGHYSHTSHTSHRSSTGGYDGGGYYAPLPSAPAVPTPSQPPPRVSAPSIQPLFDNTDRASAPAPDGLPVLSGRTKRFAAIVRRVQIALLAQDFYRGPINGVVAPALRTAIRGFQSKRGLEATGTITPATLDALMVSSQ